MPLNRAGQMMSLTLAMVSHITNYDVPHRSEGQELLITSIKPNLNGSG